MIYRFNKNTSNPKLHTKAVFGVYFKAAYMILSMSKIKLKTQQFDVTGIWYPHHATSEHIAKSHSNYPIARSGHVSMIYDKCVEHIVHGQNAAR